MQGRRPPDQVSGPYLFLDGDPVNLTDDDGRFAHFIVGGAIGFAAGFASSLVGDLIVNPPAKFRGIGWKKQAAIVTRIIGSALFKGAINGVAGALTGGLSAISTISATATNVSVYKYKMRTFQERQNLYLHENNLERNDKNLEISRIHVVTDIRRSARRWALGVGLVTGIGTSFGAAAAVGAGAIHVDSMGIHVNVADAFAGTATSSSVGVAAQVGYGISKEVSAKGARDKAVEEVRNPTPPKVKMTMGR